MASSCPKSSTVKTTSSSSSTSTSTSTISTAINRTTCSILSSSSTTASTTAASIDVASSNRPSKINDRSYSINEQSIKEAMIATANKFQQDNQSKTKTQGGGGVICPMQTMLLQRKYSIGGELCGSGSGTSGQSLSLDPSSSTSSITQQQQQLINRPETPTDEDKIDLKLISVALMKLFYPKATDAYDILLNIFQQRYQNINQRELQWNYLCKKFLNQCSLNDSDANNSKKPNGTILTNSTIASSSSSSSQTCQCQCQKKPSTTPSMINNLNDNNLDNNTTTFDSEKISKNFEQLELFTKFLIKNLNNNSLTTSSSSASSNLLNSNSASNSTTNLNWEELIVECGEKYSLKILEQDSKALKFIGENLIDFLVNLENIQSIAYKEILQLKNFENKPWKPSQPDLLPISVFVNHSETQICLTYNIFEPICRFVACFLSGLFQKMAKFLFQIVIRVKVEIGSDQYKFLIENRNQGQTLVNNDSFVQRYKTFLFNRPEQLLMSVETFRRVFPFHFICDQNLRFIQYGTGLSKIFGTQNKLNQHISNVFQIQQPNVGFFFESIRHRINLAFILRVRDNILNENFRGMELQGQIIECVESKCLLFLGSPIVKGLQSLTSRGLFLSDIPIHDATRDIILIEEQSRAQESLKRRMDKLKDTIQKANKAVEIERQKNVDLLNLIFPAQVARQLWLGKSVEARQYDDVTMLFSDIVGFTAICSTASPMAIINMLNELYTQFDVFCGEIDVYKTETIGDAYCVASGLHRRTSNHAVLAAFMALKMMDAVKNFLPKDINVAKFQMRIGLHSGSCLAGIVGVRMPRYCLFGAHVTLANKFESHSQAQRINISPTTYRLLQKFERFEFTIRDPSCLPKEYPKNMEQISAFLDRYYHPKISEQQHQSQHIAKALEDITVMDSTTPK